MKSNVGHAKAVAAAVASAVLGMPMAALAEGDSPAQGTSDWKITAAVYGYLPDLTGELKLPGGNQSADISMPIEDILDGLKMTFMGAFGAHNGQWGMAADVLYMDLGGDKSTTRNFQVGDGSLPVTANVNVDFKAWVVTLAGEYRLIGTEQWTVDVLAGTRSLSLDPSIKFSIEGPGGAIDGRRHSSSTAWDAIVGTRGRYTFGDHAQWYVPFHLDVGTGETQLTWQTSVGLGYAYRWGDLQATWRYLNWQGHSGDPIADLTMSGPMIGVAWRW